MATPGQFTIELEQEDDGRWIGDVPTLPGVMAYGRTRAEALAASSFSTSCDGGSPQTWRSPS
jgi:hypothetical protein